MRFIRLRSWDKRPFGRGREDSVSVKPLRPTMASVCFLLAAATSAQAQIAHPLGTGASDKIAVSQRGGWLAPLLKPLLPPKPIPHAAHPQSASAPLPRPRPPELAPANPAAAQPAATQPAAAKPAADVPRTETSTTGSGENSAVPTKPAADVPRVETSTTGSGENAPAPANPAPSAGADNVPPPPTPAPRRNIPPPPPIND
jgi:hypothetical protein